MLFVLLGLSKPVALLSRQKTSDKLQTLNFSTSGLQIAETGQLQRLSVKVLVYEWVVYVGADQVGGGGPYVLR